MALEFEAFLGLSTAQVCDACVRLGKPLRLAPPGIAGLPDWARLAGPVLPVRHLGSVDVFLEAFERARPGDVLVIDNGGRPDEGCIGDLTALDARAAGLGGIVVWGFHRDSEELQAIGLPIFSYGRCPAGPVPDEARAAGQVTASGGGARFGAVVLGQADREDLVFADPDGVVFVAAAEVEQVLATASAIRATERRQADAVRGGKTLREQLRFAEYLAKHASDPAYTFRRHLRRVGGAIEE